MKTSTIAKLASMGTQLAAGAITSYVSESKTPLVVGCAFAAIDSVLSFEYYDNTDVSTATKLAVFAGGSAINAGIIGAVGYFTAPTKNETPEDMIESWV